LFKPLHQLQGLRLRTQGEPPERQALMGVVQLDRPHTAVVKKA
jgi:hypothetical protein